MLHALHFVTRCQISILSVTLLLAPIAGNGQSVGGTPKAGELPAEAADADKDEIIQTAAPVQIDPAVEKFWNAVNRLRSRNPAEIEEGRNLLSAVAEDEYSHAQALLANCLMSGSYGFKKDARKAVNLFRLAAERGNAFAMVSLGSSYATGSGIRRDYEKALTWLNAALAASANYSRPEAPASGTGTPSDTEDLPAVAGELANDPVAESQATAHFLIAQILSTQKKPELAHPHFVTAATAGINGRSGNYNAAVQAALNFAFGLGTPRDSAKAGEMLEQTKRLTARMGVNLVHNYVSLKMLDEFAVAEVEEQITEAGEGYLTQWQLGIATALADKKSKNYNLADAVKWYELAARSEQVWAMLSLAQIYYEGGLGKPDFEKTFYWFEQAGGGEKPKHLLAAANLAICYQRGIGTARNEAKAGEIFRRHRNFEIVAYLGSIGQAPAGPVALDATLALTETWAKTKKDPHAQYLLGLRYYYGLGLKRDVDDARRWLTRAGGATNGAAYCMLGVIEEQSVEAWMPATREKTLKKAAEFYQKAAAAGDADGMANYAGALVDGRGVPANTEMAEDYYERCLKADPNHVRAHNNLAALSQRKLIRVIDKIDGDAITSHRKAMLDHYEKAAALGFALSASNLGSLYFEGKLVKQDYRKAYGYYEQSTQLGMAASHFTLGYMHEQGLGVDVTFTEAAYHYRLAALEGHTPALVRLVDFYLSGKGVTLDMERAMFWLNQLILRGHTRAYMTLCDILLQRQEHAKAIPILRKMAESFDPTMAGFAYDRLAGCYQNGLGVKANPARAKKYADLAVKKGNGDAKTEAAMALMKQGKIQEGVSLLTEVAPLSRRASYYLGQMYYFGTNVGEDTTKGVSYMRSSARMNHADAHYFLAGLAYNKQKDAPALDEAIRFAEQAVSLGLTKAAPLLEKLEARRKQEAERIAAGSSAE